jgi:hypothetical protein
MLDNLPIATILSLVAVVVVVIGYIRNDLTLEEALVALGAATGGAGVLGVARAQSGKGVRR